jgi:hypothetical protein
MMMQIKWTRRLPLTRLRRRRAEGAGAGAELHPPPDQPAPFDVDLDCVKAKQLGVSVTDVLDTIQN